MSGELKPLPIITMAAASYLLPDPGGEVVRQCLEEISALRQDLGLTELALEQKQALLESCEIALSTAQKELEEREGLMEWLYSQSTYRLCFSSSVGAWAIRTSKAGVMPDRFANPWDAASAAKAHSENSEEITE